MLSVICNMGFSHKIIGGQFVRSRSIVSYLREVELIKCNVIDVDKGSWGVIFRFIYGIFFSRKIVLIPGPNLLKVYLYFPEYILNKTILIAVGGWLGEFCSDDFKKSKLKKVDSIWVQTNGLKSLVADLHHRVFVLPNFKIGYKPRPPKKNFSNCLKLVFLSRVSKEKGIFEAVKAVESLGFEVEFDIYGPAHGVDIEALTLNKPKINYKGVLDQKDIQDVMSNYDVMLFPTYYPGEGFPGVIIDAFFAGITVLASDWKFNSEIILNGYNGIVLSSVTSLSISDGLLKLNSDRSFLHELKSNAHHSCGKYMARNVMCEFTKYIKEM